MENAFRLEQLMRWFGPADPVPLPHIAQAGCTGVVSALHNVPVGDIWEVEDIAAHQSKIAAYGLSWTVVESLPVHEDIKTNSGDCKLYISNYRQSLKNLAQCGIKVVTYNFMPVLDWVRTAVALQLPDRSEALLFNQADYAAVDLFMLKRPGAEQDYTPKELGEYRAHFQSMSESHKKRLFQNVLLGLPGSDVPFTPEQVLDQLKHYQHISREQLQKHLIHFLRSITPTAEAVGIQLAIHPDDPPFSVLGLPRIMSTEADVETLMRAVPSKSNGLCFCTGSFGARPDNDLLAMIRKWGTRIYFLHLRNTRRDQFGNFMEADHLDGDTDLYVIMNEVVRLMQGEKRNIPMRPDHGHKMLDDLGKDTYPGYSAIGRLKALAELRGLEYAIHRSNVVPRQTFPQ